MDLLDVFGGQDNLRLMCGAKRFRYGRGRVSFWVGEDIVRLKKGGIYYTLQVQCRKTCQTRSMYSTLWPGVVRQKFEHYSGYSLSF
jgi:hypothetical protein